MSKKESLEPQNDCLLGKCKSGKGTWCKNCGWHSGENARRLSLPLITGPDGLQRKYLGLIPLRAAEGTKNE